MRRVNESIKCKDQTSECFLSVNGSHESVVRAAFYKVFLKKIFAVLFKFDGEFYVIVAKTRNNKLDVRPYLVYYLALSVNYYGSCCRAATERFSKKGTKTKGKSTQRGFFGSFKLL